IELRDLLPDLTGERDRIDAAAHYEHRFALHPLAVRPVQVGPRFFVELAVLDVWNDADDRQPWSIADAYSFVDQIAVRRIPAGQRLVDDGDRLRFFSVRRFETATLEDRHSHRREISGRRAAQPCD